MNYKDNSVSTIHITKAILDDGSIVEYDDARSKFTGENDGCFKFIGRGYIYSVDDNLLHTKPYECFGNIITPEKYYFYVYAQ